MDWYQGLARPLLFRQDAEHAHEFALRLMARMPASLASLAGAVLGAPEARSPLLAQRLMGQDFTNPLGIAAGLDKNGIAVPALAALGVSHVEIGTVTGQAQDGNPRPRLFRLPLDEAVINRMGFNNRGSAAVAAALAARFAPVGGAVPAEGGGGGGGGGGDKGLARPPCVLGINLGKSKVVDLGAALDDYLVSVRALAPFADYLVVNVSSPNTPGLRDLQDEGRLRPLLAGVRAELSAVAPGCPLLLKIAPDLADAGIDAAVEAALDSGCSGVIATNTTIGRGGLATGAAAVAETGNGGLSGAPLRARATAVLARVARRLRGAGAGWGGRRAVVIGVGGVDSPGAAWEKIVNGADLVQVYTGLVYQGPGLIPRIQRALAEKVEGLGLGSIAEAVGRDL
jgi:dihydroorotate dehydrogenase